jgi:hypothetical protein
MLKEMKKLQAILLAVCFTAAWTFTAQAQYSTGFEDATKTGYASGNVILSGIEWNMTEVLIGTAADDWKVNLRSARLRGYGASVMAMNEDKADGAGIVTFQYRRYSTDIQVEHIVEYSTNAGVDWVALGAPFTAPASNDVQTFSEALNIATPVRIRIRATTAGAANRRMNIDELVITNFVGGGGDVLGCTDALACNYDAAATLDNGSCLFEGASCNDGNSATINDVVTGACVCEGTPITLPTLVINEIHYDPCAAQGNDIDFEFLEIYNPSTETVDLSGFTLLGVVFTFPAGASIAPGEYLIVTVNALNFNGNGYQVFQWASGGLSNAGEQVALLDTLGNIIDSVTYDNDNGWPMPANGGCSSLELIDAAFDNSLASSWQGSFVLYGTPGAANSTPGASTAYTIFEIQSDVDANGGSNLVGSIVSTGGIVTAVYSNGQFTMQDGTGPFSGIWVSASGVAIGDEVELTGFLVETNGLTLINNVLSINIQTSGNPLPANQPLATGAVSDEQWEGVLVEVTAPVTLPDAGFGEWGIDDGTGNALVDDLAVLVAPADLGVTYTVIGPVYYSFGAFKIEPRNANDVLRWGCTDAAFFNYDPLAFINDGSCSNAVGCTDPIADNYDPTAVIDDGSCVVAGCTDPLALNYNANATNDDGSCYFTLPGLVINEIHYNPCNWQGSDFDYEFIEIYNSDVVSVDLSGFVISGGATFVFPAGASIAPGEYILVAIQASNYEGNGYQVFQWTAGNLGNTSGNVTLSDAFGNVVATVEYIGSGFWPELANGSCASLELIDPSFDPADPANWQASWVLYGTPGAQNSQNIQGCTNASACNYDITATQDDGSCDFVTCLGCTYPSASNFVVSATQDDGSCIFTDACPADLNNDSIINSADLLFFLGAFGTTCN